MFMAIARASGVWSVGRAVILSILIPGLGQIYEGERTRGAGILLSVCMTSLVVAWYGVWIWLVAPLVVAGRMSENLLHIAGLKFAQIKPGTE